MTRTLPSRLVLDTTYLMPAFGVQIGLDSSEKILSMLTLLVRTNEEPLFISDLTPLEGFLKAFRLAEKGKNEDGKMAAKAGFQSIIRNSSTFSCLPHSDERILDEACDIRATHNDPFDCFIFGTARVLNCTLLTEDNRAAQYLAEDRILSWKSFKEMVPFKNTDEKTKEN